MFKKFYFFIGISSFFFSLFFSYPDIGNFYYIYPIKNNNLVSSYYGNRQLYGINNFHNGIDIPATYNTPVYSINSGIIQYIGFDGKGYGNYIIILHNNSVKSLYGHLSENILVSLGEYVSKGQIISYVGPKTLSNGKSNGNTTGPHLHFSVFNNIGKSIDPLTFEYKK